MHKKGSFIALFANMSESLYETDALLGQYLHFHYGDAAEFLPYDSGPTDALNFPVRCVTDTLDLGGIPANARALDVGCSVGRSSFELARHCAEVIGIDYSQSFISAAQTLAAEGRLNYRYVTEGTACEEADALVADGINRSRVTFETGDAMNLRSDLGSFDVVLACNLICRLPEPLKFLHRLPDLVQPGGQLVMTTPFTWLEEYTPPDNWLGGVTAQDSFEGLSMALKDDFKLIKTLDMPMLIRETARKYQWTVAQGSVWTRL